jgi:hypothetical protein
MRVFRKSHIWKDNRTFLELEAEKPSKERGFPREGHVLLKIGLQSSVKSAFKLSVDEARALRDAIDMFIRFHDVKMSELMTEQKEQFEKIPDYYQRDLTPVREDEKEGEQQGLFIFDTEKEEEKGEKESSEFYF